MNLIKAHGGKGSWPFSFERLATFPPQADHVLADLFSSVADEGLCGKVPPTMVYDLSNIFGVSPYSIVLAVGFQA